MLQKQLETHGLVYIPTCLVGPGFVWHSLLPDLLGPCLAHHGLEPGLASLRASLDHLRVGLGPGLDHHGLDPGIYWRFQLGVCRGLYHSVLPHLQGFQCLGVVGISVEEISSFELFIAFCTETCFELLDKSVWITFALNTHVLAIT
jgi:hypothetical protein